VKKRKRQSWGAVPLMGAIPTGDIKIKNPAYEDSKSLIARLRREEDVARQAPVTAAINALSQTMLQLRAAKADALFKIPSEDLSAVTTAAPANIPGTVEELRAQIKSAFSVAIIELSRAGIIVHDSGKEKMWAVSRLNLDVDWRIADNWQKLYEVMAPGGLAVFADEDVTVPQPVEEPPVEPQPTLDELLETISAESTDGRKKLVEAVTDSVLTGEFRTCWQAFIESIAQNFGYVFTEAEKKLIYDTMVRRNLSFKLPKHYDLVRVALTQAGSLPQNLLYPAERLALEVESADLNDREVRREFARRTHLLA
jgi:hypothetical protein